MVAVAQVIVGRPHQCSLDDYTKAVLAQLYTSETMAAKPVPLAYDYEESLALRPGRSNDKSDQVTSTQQGLLSPAIPTGPYFDYAQQRLGADPGKAFAVPGGAAVNWLLPVQQNSSKGGNDTSSATAAAVTVEKLTAYYEQLKGEQESLARQQLQQQLYEQQQRRQHEFMMIQQQIHQQYYQQQQQVMLMLENLRKNPEFAKQLAMFVDHKSLADVDNGTTSAGTDGVISQQATAVVTAAPKEEAKVDLQKRLPALKEQSIRNHVKDEDHDITDDDDDDDDNDNDSWGVKRLNTRQADGEHQSNDDDDDNNQSDDDHPFLKKGYTVDSKWRRLGVIRVQKIFSRLLITK